MMSATVSSAGQRFLHEPFKRPEVPRLPGATTQEATVNHNGERVRVSSSVSLDPANSSFSGLGRAEAPSGGAFGWMYGDPNRFLVGGQETSNRGTQASFLQLYGQRTPKGSVVTQEQGVAQRHGNTEAVALRVGQAELNNDGSSAVTAAQSSRVSEGDNRLETSEAMTASYNSEGELTYQAMNNNLNVSLNNGERRITGTFAGVNDVEAGVNETRTTYHDNGQTLTPETNAHGYDISTRVDQTTGTTRTRYTDRGGDELAYQIDIRSGNDSGATWNVRTGEITYHGNLARLMGGEPPAEPSSTASATSSETSPSPATNEADRTSSAG
jgi:hypothetical protein